MTACMRVQLLAAYSTVARTARSSSDMTEPSDPGAPPRLARWLMSLAADAGPRPTCSASHCGRLRGDQETRRYRQIRVG